MDIEKECIDTKPLITDVAIATTGSVDSGKSSLIGVLISGELDDGNGKARQLVAKHPHEIASGKTSSISSRTCQLNSEGDKNRAVTFIDLCGHTKYFKTTSFGISGYYPDYALVIISANKGILPITKQHMRLLISFNVPMVFIITHMDIAPVEIYDTTCEGITKICKSFAGKSTNTLFVNNIEDYNTYIKNMHITDEKKYSAVDAVKEILTTNNDGKQMIFPVITVSNTNGYYIDVVRTLIDKLPQRAFWSQHFFMISMDQKECTPPMSDHGVTNNKIINFFKLHIDKSLIPQHFIFDGTIFYIDNVYNPPGIGLVVSGITRGNRINIGDTLFIGPFGKEFIEIRIRCLHNNIRQNVLALDDHHRGCIAIAGKNISREKLRKGMIIISSQELAKNLCFHFKAVITVFTNSITLKTGYSPVLHMSTIRQTARLILENDKLNIAGSESKNSIKNTEHLNVLSAGECAVVTFKFKEKPEFIEPYNIFIFRSGDIHGVGMVLEPISIDNDPNAKPDPIKYKKFNRTKRLPRHNIKN